MKNRLATIAAFVVVSFAGFAGAAQAEEAAPPVGSWRGAFKDGSGTIALAISRDGVISIQVTGGPLTVGNWTWNPTTTGGIITIHYINGGRPARLYYSVTWVNDNTIVFSDPWFRLEMNRV